MVRREIRGRYAGSSLGFFWSFVHPLIQLAVYTLVFGVFLNGEMGRPGGSITSFALFLFCGLLPFNAFSESLGRSASCLLENANLLKNLRFPAKVIPLSLCLNALIHQGLGLLVLMAAVAVVRGGLPATTPLILGVLALQLAFMLGVSLLVAPLAVSFRDLLQLVPVVTMVWLYATPIFYTEAQAARWPLAARLMKLNPMRYYIAMTRQLLLDGELPSARRWLAAGIAAVLTLASGWWLFTRRHPRFADEL